jgi:hypothetical protein
MAKVIRTEILHCRGCDLKAVEKVWDCGCVTVEYDENAHVGPNCDNFRRLRHDACGKSGWPGN